jgi:hypothetical protein
MDNENPYAAPQIGAESPNQYLATGYPSRQMRFWRIEQLKADMRAEPLSDRESLPYLIDYWRIGFHVRDVANKSKKIFR